MKVHGMVCIGASVMHLRVLHTELENTRATIALGLN